MLTPIKSIAAGTNVTVSNGDGQRSTVTAGTSLVTLTGTQTLTNKTLTSPRLSTSATTWNGTAGTSNTVPWLSFTMNASDGSVGHALVQWAPTSGTGGTGCGFKSGDPADDYNNGVTDPIGNLLIDASGNGVAGNTAPIMFALDSLGSPVVAIVSLASDPSGGGVGNGCLYYNSSTNKFRGLANGSWVDLH